MDPAGVGALIGVGIMFVVGCSMCIYDRYKNKPEYVKTTNPLLVRHQSYRPKNLFSHVEI